MAFDKDAFLSAMDSMTVMELNDLVKAIEEKFGVSAAAMAAPAAGGTTPAGTAPATSSNPTQPGAVPPQPRRRVVLPTEAAGAAPAATPAPAATLRPTAMRAGT